MTNPPTQDIIIRLDTIDQLFNAPDINPFSEEEVDVLGEPALLRAIRRLLAHRVKNWEGMRLILELPADQITPGLEQADPRSSAPLQHRQDRGEPPEDSPVTYPQSDRTGHSDCGFDHPDCFYLLPLYKCLHPRVRYCRRRCCFLCQRLCMGEFMGTVG